MTQIKHREVSSYAIIVTPTPESVESLKFTTMVYWESRKEVAIDKAKSLMTYKNNLYVYVMGTDCHLCFYRVPNGEVAASAQTPCAE